MSSLSQFITSIKVKSLAQNLIIGLKKHLRENFKLKEVAKKKKIPIYSFEKLTIYQLIKFIKYLN